MSAISAAFKARPALAWQVPALSLCFLGLNLYLFTLDFYWALALPAIAAVVALAFYRPMWVMLALAFAIPLSVQVDIPLFGLGISLPNEPLLALLTGLLLLQITLKGGYPRQNLLHPISLVILAQFAWMGIATLFSELPLVSLKALVARGWFLGGFFFLAIELFRRPRHLIVFMWLLLISLGAVIIYTLQRHADHGWAIWYSNTAPDPFFAGHGDYAALIALLMPLVLMVLLGARHFRIGPWGRFGLVFFLVLLAIGLLFSFTRAAWLSALAGFAFGGVMLLRIPIKMLAFLAIIFGLSAGFLANAFIQQARRNHITSSNNFDQHLESVSNVTTDDSNTERLNRWASALRMWNQRPIVGWGPGTYMFTYAPFQLSSEKTAISTDFGTLGNAHSEYLGPLAEQGVLGLLLMLALVAVSIGAGLKTVYTHPDPRARYVAAGTLMGLATYYVHGLMNNYLDTDKAAMPVFAFLALLVALQFWKPAGRKSAANQA